MTQSTALAPGVSEATSTDIAVAAGAVVTVGIYAATPSTLPTTATFMVMQDTPGADNAVKALHNGHRSCVLTGPGLFRVKRSAYAGAPFGVFVEK